MKDRILIVDDETAICVSLRYSLAKEYDADTASNRSEALKALASRTYQAVLLDVFLGTDDGIELLSEIKRLYPDIVVIIMTAHGTIQSSVTAMKAGAFTYITKPFDPEELKIYIRQGLEYRKLNEKVAYLSDELQSRYRYSDMIGKSPQMQKVYDMLERLKDNDAPVIITGESGTGKELAARALHFMGSRKDERFIDVNCAAIPEGLLEMEFFGYKRGAFTGASGDKKGKFEAADKGTLFLDEIGDMPLGLQGKLLRVLQDMHFTPIGSNESKPVDVRVIAASNKDLPKMVQEGTFRKDLYYRLSVITIPIPPLRERTQDIPLLAHNFIEEFNAEHGRSIRGLSREAERLLMTYDFPGNIRELRNIIEYAVIMCEQDTIRPEDFPRSFTGSAEASKPAAPAQAPLTGTLYEIEKQAILQAMERNEGYQKKTAEELGISERSLYNKLKEYGYQKK